MKRFITFLILALINFTASVQATAQANTQAVATPRAVAKAMQTAKQAETMITDFVAAINNVPKQGNTTQIMSYFAPSFKNEVTIFDLNGKMQVNTRDFFATQDIYMRYCQPNNTVDYKITKILKSYSNDTMAYAVFEMEYSLLNKGTVYRKGEQTLTYTMARRGTRWQFVRATTFIHYTAVEKGNCACKLFNNGNEYLALLETPQGEDYLTKQYAFKFTPLNKSQTEIEVEGLKYILNKDGQTTITMPDKRTIKMKTNKDAEAVNVILNDQHKDNCFSVIFK